MLRALVSLLLATALAVPALAQPLTPGQEKFRALFKEMVETNTALSNGSCTELAGKIASREDDLDDSHNWKLYTALAVDAFGLLLGAIYIRYLFIWIV